MAAASHPYVTPFGDFQLQASPHRPIPGQLAWCAADTLLLREVHHRNLASSGLLVVNDAHGALCVALQPQALWTDSALSVAALRSNEIANQCEPTPIVWSTAAPPGNAVAAVVMRVPKILAYFEYQLQHLAQCLPTGTLLFAAGMDKHLSAQTASLLERYIGPTERHPGQQKARLFSAVRGSAPPPGATANSHYHCPALAANLESLPNVFSRDKLDRGSELLLAQLHSLPPVALAIDLACGNGVLGLTAFQRGLARNVVFADESAMAIQSARANARRLFPGDGDAFSLHHGDGLRDYQGVAAQLILCNPPFHQGHAVDESSGRELVAQCAPHLEPGGRLYMVSNRHLNYLAVLQRNFSAVEQLATNRLFRVSVATRGPH